jgi:hypothetical protein
LAAIGFDLMTEPALLKAAKEDFRMRRGDKPTAVHNCTRDERRPFKFGNQVLISSHRAPQHRCPLSPC